MESLSSALKNSLTALLVIYFSIPVLLYTGQELAKQAKVTLVQARQIALKAHPGKVTEVRMMGFL